MSLRSGRSPRQRTPATGPSRVTIHRRPPAPGRGGAGREEGAVTSGGARRVNPARWPAAENLDEDVPTERTPPPPPPPQQLRRWQDTTVEPIVPDGPVVDDMVDDEDDFDEEGYTPPPPPPLPRVSPVA